MSDLLLELFSEEIPARLQQRGAADLQRLVTDLLSAEALAFDEAVAFATARRLTLRVTGLPDAQADRREERKGPRVGAPDKAIEGFMKAAGLASIDEAIVKEDGKGAFYVAVIDQRGRRTADLLAERLPQLLKTFPWPKSMRWGESENELRWVRPLHSILCTFGGEVVPFTLENGERPITSGACTAGHRFEAPETFEATTFEDYCETLLARKVILDGARREEKIWAEATALASAAGLEVIADPGLLAEVSGLAEWPVARMGRFDEKFLAVPDEALIAAMRGHQKYFSVRDPKTGRLAPHFICVANIDPADGGQAMMEGYERVLAARLSDAWFLYHQDLKTPLAQHAERLKDVTYFDGLGTTWEKVGRTADLAERLALALGAAPAAARGAALLCKADLPTEMVGEFPELQGIMARYYYLAETGTAADPAIAEALRDHYKPAGQGDLVPTAPLSVTVALADKLTTLAMFWSIGEKPTGSKDPFALRRMALGVIQLVLENGARLSLRDSVAPLLDTKAQADLLGFFHDRLRVYLKEKGHRYDHIEAVLTPDSDDLGLIVTRLHAIDRFLATPEGGDLVAAYKRAANILKAEEKKEGGPFGGEIDTAQLEAAEEQALYTALEGVEAALAAALPKDDITAALAALSSLREPLDRFFTEVTVNVEAPELRKNRLSLLHRLALAFGDVADFAKLEG
ncbi:glycyl-tRNA synthetase beta subunit [Parvularcula bermudensis HTCC2503]|uniref:Glycine--tRNA ligase beta subunit n=1 Tax=Parvularcula bermudensis (strain ATCC BAA-594 / HTCC2503 / KCTC 12087) TaxID=314260 RepID=E0TCK5_PARBH|nr:glycine--tRNA ligase subunit beta [Parvularcula bermudensis]ADM08594.1 glycyl-tRNA synthetase beta subunit [Parvularcula bermudensis HTCC2503]